MTASLTFTGTPNAAYTVPGTHTSYGDGWTYDSDGSGIATSSAFSRLVDNAICSGLVTIECIFDFSGTPSYWSNAAIILMDASLTGVKIEFRGDRIEVNKEVSGSNGSNIYSAAATNTGVITVLVEFDVSTGDIDIYKDSVLVTSSSYTDTLSGLRAGMQAYDDGTPVLINTLNTVTDGGAGGVTIDDSPASMRVTESRTFTITGLGTTLNTGNVDAYVNADTNTAITPSSVTNTTGDTYEIVITVPDAYAGLKYNLTGYPVIISTPDGDATSGNIPYLPVTGNDFVNPSAVPGDVIVSSGTYNVGDQAEWDTLGTVNISGTDYPIITVNADSTFTYRGSDPDGVTFDLRIWDDFNSTWGSFATQTLSTGGVGGGDSIGFSSAGLSSSGFSSSGLSNS